MKTRATQDNECTPLDEIGLTDFESQMATSATWPPEIRELFESMLESVVRLRRAELELQGRTRVLEMLATGARLGDILEALVVAAEEITPNMRCSVLLLDHQDGCLKDGVAPSLPEFYSRAVDHLAIGPARGSCGTSAYTGERTIVEDVMVHPYWSEFRELAQSAGFRACWSEPIFASDRTVLGTFAMYYDEPRRPDESEIRFIHTTAQQAGIAIERRQQEAEIQAHREHLEELVQERTAALRSLSSELFLTEEKERSRLAQDLHDGLSQWLCLAQMKISALRSDNPDQAMLSELHDLLENASRAARSLNYQLSPPALHEFGLGQALERMVDDLGKDYGLSVSYSSEGREGVLPEKVAVVLFRAARELLINVAKHSGTQAACLQLLWGEDELELRVQDEGRGFDVQAQRNGGFGLFGTRERLEHVRGRMAIHSSPESGTRVHLTVPLNDPR